MESKSKKKILFLITKSNWGGAQRYVYDLATNLNPSLFEVVVALGGDGELYTKLTQARIRTVTIPGLQRDISLSGELRASFAVAKILKKEKPDVLHVNSSKAGAIGTLLGRILRVQKIVFTAHGWAFNEDRPTWQQFLFKVVHYLTVLQSHTTITVSHGLKQQLNWTGIQKKMHTVHPGRALSELKTKSEARGILETKITDSEANLSDFHRDLWIGTIAELHPIKRLNRAIDAMAALTREHTNIRYIIIGDGQLRTQLQQQVRDLGIEKHVFFTGAIHEAARLLPAFDIFTLPSKSESFGYVLLEAGLAQLPVVTTNVGGITDIITDKKTGLVVEPDDTRALREALQTLIIHTQLRSELADAHHIKTHTFSVDKMCAKTAALY